MTWQRTLGFGLLLALGYFVGGWLGRLLAVPPGYAMAVFPPAGIALAALLLGGKRLAFGIWLGSTALNLWISLQGAAPGGLWHALPLAGLIALGATLQALLGLRLVTRYVAFPAGGEPPPLRFLLLGGPLACLVSASFGMLCLKLFGVLPWEKLPFNWFTWWVGDTIGVLIFTPLLLILMDRGRYRWPRRRLSVALPLLITFLVAVGIFLRVNQWNAALMNADFQSHAKRLQSELEKRLALKTDTVVLLESLLQSHPGLERKEFSHIARHLLEHLPEAQAIEWVDRVPATERAAFEQRLRAEGFAHFQITERDANDQLKPAQQRAEYFVVNFVEPFHSNQRAFGFDLGSNQQRLAAIQQAIRTGKVTATAPLNLVQGHNTHKGLLLITPVFDDQNPPQRRLRGLILVVLRMGHLLENMLAHTPQNAMHVHFYDRAADNLLLYDNLPPEKHWHPSEWRYQQTLEFGGRNYLLELIPTPQWLDQYQNWQSWLVLVGGLSFCALLTAFLLVQTGHTARVQAEVAQRTRELRQSEQASHAREMRLDSILNQAIDAILITNDQGVILLANPAAVALFEAEDLVGHALIDLIDQHLATFAELNQRLSNSATHETVIRTRQDRPLPVEFSWSPVELGDARHYTWIVRDISERKRLEQMKNEFVSTVSHELRTPLTSISGALGLVMGRNNLELPDKVRHMLDIAHKNSLRLGFLINDLLDMEKLVAGKMQFDFHSTPLIPLLEQAIEANRLYGADRRVKIVLQTPLPAVMVSVDTQRLMQVMNNLLSNAIKYSPEDGQVSVSVIRNDRRVRVAVTDQGPGIPASFRQRIFQKFSQADSSDSRQKGGTGLGLAITRELIERMHGQIDFISEEGRGSQFFFELPIEAPTEAAG